MRKKYAKTILLKKKHFDVQKLIKNLNQNKTDLKQDKKHHKAFLSKKYSKFQTTKRYRTHELPKVELTNYADIQYWGQLGFANKKGEEKKFNVLFDTGSSWLWLPSSECDACAKYNIKNFYKSSKEVQPEGIYTIHYGKGSVEGDIVKDDFMIGDKQIKSQYFLEIKKMVDMPVLMFDGLIGLGPRHHLDDGVQKSNNKKEQNNKQNTQKSGQEDKRKISFSQTMEDENEENPIIDKKDQNNQNFHGSFLNTLLSNKLIDKNQFSIYLNSKGMHSKIPPSIIFGGSLAELEDGKFEFCDSDPQGFHWSAEFSGLKLKSSEEAEARKVDKNSKFVLLDSGTSMLTFPQKDFDEVLNVFKKYDNEAEYNADIKEIYAPNLNDDSKLPHLIFGICGKEFILEAEFYSSPAIIQYQEESKVIHKRKGTYFKISSLEVGGLSILGDPFLMKFYTLFDATENNRKIGMVKAKHQKKETVNVKVKTQGQNLEDENGSNEGKEGFEDIIKDSQEQEKKKKFQKVSLTESIVEKSIKKINHN